MFGRISCTSWRLDSINWCAFMRNGPKAACEGLQTDSSTSPSKEKWHQWCTNALVPGAYMRLTVVDGCQMDAGFRNTSFIILLEINVSSFYCNLCKSDLDCGPLRAYWRNLETWSKILGMLFSWVRVMTVLKSVNQTIFLTKCILWKSKLLIYLLPQCLQTKTAIHDNLSGAKTCR